MKKVSFLITIILLNIYCTNSFAQNFTLDNNQSFVNAKKSAVAIGDIDNDGDVDIFVAGLIGNSDCITNLYINNNGIFETSNQIFKGIHDGSLLLGDINNNGFLDLIVMGIDNDLQIVKYYSNNDGVFTEIENNIIPFGEYSHGDLGDYDNDGDLDLIISGNNQSKIYSNHEGTFQPEDFDIRGLNYTSCKWIDYDNNGALDLMISGEFSSKPNTLFYKNIDNDFIEDEVYVEDAMSGDVAWSDMDGDGDADLAISGFDVDLRGLTYIYRNDNFGRFKKLETYMLGVSKSSLDWGDVTNDGLPDLLVSGSCDACNVLFTSVYDSQNGVFDDLVLGFRKVEKGDARYLDYDNDGDLDVLVTGVDSYDNPFTGLYRNNGGTNNYLINQAPLAPAEFNSTVNDNNVLLEWNGATDDHTPIASLSYQVVLRKIDNAVKYNDNTAKEYDLIVPINGNAGNAQKYQLFDLKNGTYQWKVQTVDGQYKTSSFSEWQNFNIEFSSTNDVNNSTVNVYPNPIHNELHINIHNEYFDMINVTNIWGKTIYQISQPKSLVSLDFRNYPSGVYFIDCIKNEKRVISRKVIK